MRVLINTCYGGYRISEECAQALGLQLWEVNELPRTDERLLGLYDYWGSDWISGGHSSHIVAVEIPDTATDWEISEYDGSEEVIYVENGKIHHHPQWLR